MSSDYEKIRLENIKKNADFLKELGFNDNDKGIEKQQIKNSRNNKTYNLKNKRKRELTDEEKNDESNYILHSVGTRQSARVRGQKLDDSTSSNSNSNSTGTGPGNGFMSKEEKQLQFIQQQEQQSNNDYELNKFDDEDCVRSRITAQSLRDAIEESCELHSDSISNQVR